MRWVEPLAPSRPPSARSAVALRLAGSLGAVRCLALPGPVRGWVSRRVPSPFTRFGLVLGAGPARVVGGVGGCALSSSRGLRWWLSLALCVAG